MIPDIYNPQSFNAYHYALNQPTNIADSSGQDDGCCDLLPEHLDFEAMYPAEPSIMDGVVTPPDFNLGAPVPSLGDFSLNDPDFTVFLTYHGDTGQGFGLIGAGGPIQNESLFKARLGYALSTFDDPMGGPNATGLGRLSINDLMWADAAASGFGAGLGGGLNAAARSSLTVTGIRMIPGAVHPPVTYPVGTFSVVSWSGYPQSVPRPSGPFRLLEGEEYQAARRAASNANRALHKTNPTQYAGLQIHEIHTVKFGGSPTAIANKIGLSRGVHIEVTNFWSAVQRSISAPR